jgi:hypothetical protein
MQGPFTKLPRPPQNRGGNIDPFELEKWFTRIWLILSGIPGITWDIIDKTGSKLSDLEFRTHIMLQNVFGADVTNTDKVIEDTDHVKHVSDAQAKYWQDGSAAGFQSMAENVMIATPHQNTTRPSYEGLYIMGGM